MTKKISLIALTSLCLTGTALASGYRIPEQSINSTALSAAYIANAHGADAAYYNPANMNDGISDKWQVEGDLQYIHLTSIEYTDATTASHNSGSRSEEFLLPHLHVVSPDYHDFRVGIAFTTPGGLSKRWDNPYPRASSKEFTLRVFELNPSVSYKTCKYFSLAAGIRAIYADGKVKSNYNNLLSRDMDGDTTEWGFNLAATLKPVDDLKIALTYRSKVDLDLEGDAKLHYYNPAVSDYNGPGAVSVPLPAVLTLATSYTIKDTTIELTWDRTYWSKYANLDFSYNQTFSAGHPFYTFDQSKPKNWENSDAYRIGVTHKLNNTITLMVGFAMDESPVPDATLGFELPDSDAKIYSLGGRYRLNDSMELGMAYLFSDKDSRYVNNTASSFPATGTFDNSQGHLVVMGLEMTF